MIKQGDTLISEAIKRGLEDLRKNVWLLDDIFSDFKTSIYLKEKYGQKEIDAIKDWFLNNKIQINLQFRLDKEEYPCVTIALGSSSEKEEMKHSADLSASVEVLMPNEIGKPIAYITKPFVPVSYNSSTGVVIFPDDVPMRGIVAGQVLVNPNTAEGFVINEVLSNGVKIDTDLNANLNLVGIIPKFKFYRVRREHAFFQETYSIGCHSHGDPLICLWLHSIVLYCLLRYKESLLEAEGFTQAVLSSTDMVENNLSNGPSGDNIYSRYINLSGMVENSWLKTPRRVLEAAGLAEVNNETIKSGIKILSNLNSIDSLDTEDDLWTTVKDGDIDF